MGVETREDGRVLLSSMEALPMSGLQHTPYLPPWYNRKAGIATGYYVAAIVLALLGGWGLFIGIYDFDDSNGCGAFDFAIGFAIFLAIIFGFVLAYAVFRQAILEDDCGGLCSSLIYILCGCCCRCVIWTGILGGLAYGTFQYEKDWKDADAMCSDTVTTQALSFLMVGWALLLVLTVLLCCIPALRDRWEMKGLADKESISRAEMASDEEKQQLKKPKFSDSKPASTAAEADHTDVTLDFEGNPVSDDPETPAPSESSTDASSLIT